MKRLLILFIAMLLIIPAFAQGTFEEPRESGRAYVLSTASGTLQLAQFNQEFGGTIDIDYSPIDPRRWARIDNYGIIRYNDPSNPNIFEGVYTFAPFVENFQVAEPEENKVFAREVEWSEDGQMLAFRLENNASTDLNQGVWFWQQLRELDTDPSYQILRHCPPFCTAAGTPDSDPGWRSLALEWSSDNTSILITIRLIGENRRALEIRQARRDHDQVQAGTRPNPLMFDYGHWANDGLRLVVSGNGPDGTPVFGTIDRTGSVAFVYPVTDIGMVWVQDAVQTPEGSLIMLGNTVGAGAPLQIIMEDGTQLTPPIGDVPPDVVKWSPDRRAVLLQSVENTYVAQIDGTIYDITNLLVDNSPNIDWIATAMPAEFTQLALPIPTAEGEFTPEATMEVTGEFNIGDLLVLNAGVIDIYQDPVGDSGIVGALTTGEELIITGGPLRDGDVIWYRIQTLNFTGWIRNTQNLTPAQ